MPIITPSSLYTHVYDEIIKEITRNDETITQYAIDTAVQEAKLYLSRYDLSALFGDADTEPAVQDILLSSLIKDMAVWHLMRLSNTGTDDARHRAAYQDAIATLKNIMNGQAEPEGWPYADTSAAPEIPDGDSITWSSNPKRNNHY